ncbi:class I SAM-dependent methyltransferase [Elioraea sp.]|uniref:class I SAM-dependent methyltransferase n=1 Tax=Elioraea sp. TaxID=2185103 RepID=UPI003F6FDB0D
MSAAPLSRQDRRDDRLDWLCAHLATTRFLPVPPPELMTCGDGDYRAIGAEFLGHFVRRAGLDPTERVLDLGCGIGRMTVPLTQYLAETARYEGVDVDAAAIAWCARAITPVYPQFTFRHLDVIHPLYNPAGTLAAEHAALPFASASFDVVLLVSVLTHLDRAAVRRYAAEIARVLAPGGRCFATAFLLNGPARAGIATGSARPAFPDRPEETVLHADPEAPLAAVAHDEDALLASFLAAGLRRRRPAAYGTWSGRKGGASFQDICVFERG